MALDADTQQRLKGYYEELRQKRVHNAVGYTAIAIGTLLFIMVVSGDRFDTVLGMVGLSGIWNPETGAYADCSDPVNRNNGYCSRGRRAEERSWQELRDTGSKGAAFSISGR